MLWRRWRKQQKVARIKLAMLEFGEQRDRLEREFLQAAEATGKPRGLRWKQCDLRPGQLFAIDPQREELYALAGATISFEAIEGGGMEDVEAVGNLRFATAVFAHRQRRWTTDGRVIFNLEPQQALERFQNQLVPVDLTEG